MKRAEKVAALPEKPLLIFDGDCNFCRRWIRRWQQSTGDRVEYIPFQDPRVAEWFPELPRQLFEQSVYLIEPDGSVFYGAEAAFRALSFAPRRRFWRRLYEKWPIFAKISERFYRFVAKNRTIFSALTRFFWGKHVEKPTFFLVRGLFLRALGAVYFIAFVSLGVQISGLIGSNGILPAAPFMNAVREGAAQQNIGAARYALLPTLCWFNASDGFLNFLCGGGVVLSLLLIFGVAPAPVLTLLWIFYLSLTTVCRDFLSFQWDNLLLETGFLAIFCAPIRIFPNVSREAPPSPTALWLLRLLLFKLMFMSGAVKLVSGDLTWRNLTALNFHYETQPIPNLVAWYAHQLPEWFQKFSCAAMFGIELGAPFLIFAPRRLRFFGGASLVFLQLLIVATGNYAFFNLLSIVLCLPLLDDAVLRHFFPREIRSQTRVPRWRKWLLAVIAAVILVITAVQLVGMFRVRVNWPAPVVKLYAWAMPFRSVNSYGLFAVMTTTRPEIIIEGSHDGENWRVYEFKYKVGDVKRRPPFVAPHQPRLDWQMWFEALHYPRGVPPSAWFVNFCVRLLQGAPEVVALLAENPFPEAPPRYIRATVYDYRFTDFARRRETGAWWRREMRGLYCPILTLRAE
jgi:predicted DCC family thiol-disulfide oxidoreductase YuxK